MDKTAIKVTKVSKIYKLYDTPSARLKDALGLSRKANYTILIWRSEREKPSALSEPTVPASLPC